MPARRPPGLSGTPSAARPQRGGGPPPSRRRCGCPAARTTPSSAAPGSRRPNPAAPWFRGNDCTCSKSSCCEPLMCHVLRNDYHALSASRFSDKMCEATCSMGNGQPLITRETTPIAFGISLSILHHLPRHLLQPIQTLRAQDPSTDAFTEHAVPAWLRESHLPRRGPPCRAAA